MNTDKHGWGAARIVIPWLSKQSLNGDLKAKQLKLIFCLQNPCLSVFIRGFNRMDTAKAGTPCPAQFFARALLTAASNSSPRKPFPMIFPSPSSK
jgi:hypothetical protein